MGHSTLGNPHTPETTNHFITLVPTELAVVANSKVCVSMFYFFGQKLSHIFHFLTIWKYTSTSLQENKLKIFTLYILITQWNPGDFNRPKVDYTFQCVFVYIPKCTYLSDICAKFWLNIEVTGTKIKYHVTYFCKL